MVDMVVLVFPACEDLLSRSLGGGGGGRYLSVRKEKGT